MQSNIVFNFLFKVVYWVIFLARFSSTIPSTPKGEHPIDLLNGVQYELPQLRVVWLLLASYKNRDVWISLWIPCI